MKKLVAGLLAFVMAVMTTVTVFGATVTSKDVEEKLNSSIAYAFDGNYGVGGYDCSKSKNFNTYLKGMGNFLPYQSAYETSVLDEFNGGTISDETLAIALQNLLLMGEAEDYIALVDKFLATPATSYSGYYLTYACETANMLAEADLVEAICVEMASKYTMGVGTDFWGGYGTSADDLAMFIICLSLSGEDYTSYLNDAKTLLQGYYTANGYDNWGANADSTALALSAYVCLDDDEKADEAYKLLIDNFYDSTTGGFTSAYDPYYATADAVYGMSFYYSYLLSREDDPVEPETTTQQSTTKQKDAKDVDKSLKSPETGNNENAFIGISFVVMLGSVVVIMRARKASNK